jgi:hypothetical protein
MHIRLSSSTLLALAAAVVWSADPARVPTAACIDGTVTLVTPGGAAMQPGAYPSRRTSRVPRPSNVH